MAATYTVTYEAGEIRITPSAGPAIQSIPIHSFTQFQINGGQVTKSNQVSPDQFTQFQKLLRCLDAIKDAGEPPAIQNRVRIIPQLMGVEGDVIYSWLDAIKGVITTTYANRIKKTTWLKPNERAANLILLPTRKTYKESGIDPKHIIQTPQYQSNIASEIIDPFTRRYDSTPTYFPTSGNSLTIDRSFFSFFGFTHCELESTRTRQTSNNDGHTYRIQLSPTTIITQEPVPPTDEIRDWFAGNPSKNQYFQEHPAENDHPDEKLALLNIKEMGDVLQVLLMMICQAITGGIHTIVTCDEIVFIQSIQLGLDCVVYHHQPSAEHSVRHFKSNYTIQQAQQDWEEDRRVILQKNDALLAAITRLRDRVEGDEFTVNVKGYSTDDNFNFCTPFYDAILEDMRQINEALRALTFDTHVPSLGNGENQQRQRLEMVFTKITEMKKQYLLVSLFVLNASNQATFNSNTKSYTHTPPPLTTGYRLEGYRPKGPSFFSIYTTIYEKQYSCSSIVPTRRGGSRQRHIRQRKQRGGVIDALEVLRHDYHPVMYYPNEGEALRAGQDGSVDLHALWLQQVEHYLAAQLTGFQSFVPLYLDEVLSFLYHDAYVNEYVLFGLPLRDRIRDFFIAMGSRSATNWNQMARELQTNQQMIFGNIKAQSRPMRPSVKTAPSLANTGRSGRIALQQSRISQQRQQRLNNTRRRLKPQNVRQNLVGVMAYGGGRRHRTKKHKRSSRTRRVRRLR